MIAVDVLRIPTKGPGDVSGLMQLLKPAKSRLVDPCGARQNRRQRRGQRLYPGICGRALCQVLSPHLKLPPREVETKIAFVMSGGTEGVLSPHLTVFSRNEVENAVAVRANSGEGKRLSIGIAHTRDFLPEEIGRRVQIEETIKAVHAAMRDAGIDDAQDVHFVQIKCPLLTSERIEAALDRGNKTVTGSAYGSMGYSRGASALGVAEALGEIDDDIDEGRVLKDWNLFSSVAPRPPGIELMHNVIIVMGNSAQSASRFVIGHAVMSDAIDLAAVVAALRSRGLGVADAQTTERLGRTFSPRPRPPPTSDPRLSPYHA